MDEAIGKALTRVLTPGQAHALLIATSMLFAGAILATAWFMRGWEHQQTVIYSLIAIWWIPFSLLTSATCRTSGRGGEDSTLRS